MSRTARHDRAAWIPALARVVVLGAVVLGAVVLGAAGAAQAGNRSTYLIGGRAAGMGGAYTAFGDEGSAAWYNPAALSLNDRHSFDLSASAYGFEILDVDGMIQTVVGGAEQGSDFHTSGLAIVPTSLDAVFRLSEPAAPVRHVLAISVLVPFLQDVSQTFEFENPDFGYGQRFRLADKETRYLVGPSYGVWLNEIVSVGLSLFAVYDQVTSTSSVVFGQDFVDNQGERANWFYSYDESVDGMVLGLTAAASVHVRLAGFRIGAQLRSPIFRVYTSADVTQREVAYFSESIAGMSQGAIQPGGDIQDAERSMSEWGFEQTAPLELTLGLGYDVPKSWRIGVDVTWHPKLALDDAVDFRNTIDVAVGGEVWLTPNLPLSLGFFTDFAPGEEPVQFGDRQMNYYGGTAALTIISPYAVSGSEKTDRIVFATTIGLHYAYGTGDAVGMRLDLDQSFDPILTRRSATGHDVHVFVGSTVRF